VREDLAMALTIRPSRADDDRALADLDYRCWSVEHDVLPRRDPDEPFFYPSDFLDDVLVAEVGGVPVGWVRLRPPSPLQSNAHVQQIQGLVVDPCVRRQGVGRALVDAARELARQRGARRITLRVLGTNAVAQRLYKAAGFTVEGVLPGEFHVGGRDVDDVLMGQRL
jgi:ribosomal protein S18 acetylase RimI-like enzyme